MENRILLETKIKEYLAEDLGFGDITTGTILEDKWIAKAEIIVK